MHYHYFTIEQRESLKELMQRRLDGEPLQKALERLHEPDYGTCTRCGKDIAFVLLEDNPAALLCRACSAPD
jgi:RNA polymerase-binding transcription factor DksA